MANRGGLWRHRLSMVATVLFVLLLVSLLLFVLHQAHQSDSGKNVSQLDFVSDQIGWAISSTASNSSFLLKTVDGGYTWTVISYMVS